MLFSLSNRAQRKDKNIVEYFHHKARLCRKVHLSFRDSKHQIIEGLYSRDLYYYLLVCDHVSEDDFTSDNYIFDSINNARSHRFREFNASRSRIRYNTVGDNSGGNNHNQQPTNEMSYSKSTKDTSSVTCFNCGFIVHF